MFRDRSAASNVSTEDASAIELEAMFSAPPKSISATVSAPVSAGSLSFVIERREFFS